MSSAAQGRAEGVLEALDREQERAAEPWLTPASLRVLAADNLALLAENEGLRRRLKAATPSRIADLKATLRIAQLDSNDDTNPTWDEFEQALAAVDDLVAEVSRV